MKPRLPPNVERCSNASSSVSISTVLAAPPKTRPRYGVNSQSADAGRATAVTNTSASAVRRPSRKQINRVNPANRPFIKLLPLSHSAVQTRRHQGLPRMRSSEIYVVGHADCTSGEGMTLLDIPEEA